MPIAFHSPDSRRVAIRVLLLIGLAVHAPVRAGSIFDDDYVPSKPQAAPLVTPSEGSAPAPATSPDQDAQHTPTPVAPASPAPDSKLRPPAQAMLAVPDSAQQAQSRKLFKETFAGELSDSSPVARRALAVKLLAEADKVADNPSDRFVLLVGACDAASEAGDLHLASQAAETAAAAYRIDAAHLSADAFLKAPPKALSPADATLAVDNALELETALVRSGDYSTAARLLTAMEPLASRDQDMTLQVKERAKRLADIRLARDRADKAVEHLKKTPDDPTANAVVGEFLSFVNSDFRRGLPLLAHSDDAAMRIASKRDLDGASDFKQQIAIGDAWWELAGKKATRELFKGGMRERAAFWYSQAMASGHITGLSRTLLQKRIASASSGHEVVFLSALKETSFDGLVVDSNFGLGKNSLGPGGTTPVRVDGIDYPQALGFNPVGGNTARIVYGLGRQYRRFTGAVGVNDTAGSYAATLTFKIFGDGKELWHSHPFREMKLIEKFDVSVMNVDTLELKLECNGPGHNAHCVWIEPRLEAR